MGLDDILQAMEREVAAEISVLEVETEAEVARILQEAEQQAEAVRHRHLSRAEEKLQTEGARILNDARLQDLQIRMMVREDLIQDALALARQQLADVPRRPDYRSILTHLVSEVLEQLGNELAVHTTPQDEALVHELLKGLGLWAEIHPDLDASGGLVATSPDGRIACDNTLESRLAKATQLWRGEIADLVLGE